MKNVSILIVLIFSLFTSPFLALAGGSSFSRYGFGDIIRYGDSRSYAMAGTGIALVGDGFINTLNPAGLAQIATTRFTTGVEYINYLSKDEAGSSFYSTGGFRGIALAIPISTDNGIVLSTELTPYSQVHYGITSSFLDVSTQATENKTFFGSGGLSYIGLGLSVSPFKSLFLGARANYIFGNLRQYQTISYDISDFTPTTFDRDSYFSGFTFTLGGIFEGLGDLFKMPDLRPLSVGVTLTTGTSLDANIQRTYPSSSYFGGDSISTEDGTAGIPLSLGFGLSYVIQNRYRFLGDITIENWADTKYFNLSPENLRNSFRASVGFEAAPAKDADSFIKRITYRAGLSYNSTYYRISGIGINEYLISGGLGLPVGPESQLNIGLHVGMRGTMDNQLQKDTIIRLSVAISASELWFLKFDEE